MRSFLFKRARMTVFLFFLLAFLLVSAPGFGQLGSGDSKLKDREPPKFEEDIKNQEAPPAPPVLPPSAPSVNPETLRLMEMIERKNRELKQREEEMALREKNLQALETKISEDLKKIETALARSEEQVGIKRDLIDKNVNNLVKVYSAMKAEEASRLLETLDEGVAIQILSRMKSKTAGKVLGRMNTDVAKRISEKIAGKRMDEGQPAMTN